MRKRSQSGFALLLIFMMAASIAVMLYLETPRLMFEAQRQKEQLFIERGEQYRRAIQVFVRANKRLPQRIEELERFQEKRFLRRKFKDPMTGKDEWRLIHADASGALTDSLTQKKPDPLGKDKDKDKTSQTASGFGTGTGMGQPGFGSAGAPVQYGIPGQPGMPGQPGEVPAALQRRGSDRPAIQNSGQPVAYDPNDPNRPYDPNNLNDPNNPNNNPQYQNQQVYDPNNPNSSQGTPGQFPGQYPGQAPGVVPGQPGYPGQAPGVVPGQPGYPGQVPGMPTIPGMQSNPMAPGAVPGQYPGQYPGGVAPVGSMPGQPNYPGGFQPQYPGQQYPGQTPPTPGAYPGAPPPGFRPANSQMAGGMGAPGMAPGNAAAQLINQILTTPRGAAGIGGMGGQQGLGAGIAGVATTVEGEGIRVYNEKTKYKEWEFLYDAKMERAPGSGGNMQGQQGQGGLSGNSNRSGSGSGSGFGSGNNSGFGSSGNNSGFGSGTMPRGGYSDQPFQNNPVMRGR